MKNYGFESSDNPFLVHTQRIPVERDHTHQDRTVTRNDLSIDQRKALKDVLDLIHSGDRQLVSLGGFAGSGKSTLVPIISQELGNTRNTAFATLTGKASNVLSRKLAAAGVHDAAHVGTIHSLLYKPVFDKKGHIVDWIRNSELVTYDGTPVLQLILDEASMVGSRIMEDLLSFGVPILAVGDPGQLPPVQDTSVIEKTDVTLTKIHRQAEGNPIIRLANAIRIEGDIPRGWEPSEEIRFTDREQGVFPIIGEGFSRLGLNFGIMVRTNQLRQNFNTNFRSHPDPEVGDIVICLKNAPPIYNGMRGILEDLREEGLSWYRASIRFPDDGIIINSRISKAQFGMSATLQSTHTTGMLFDYGNSMTVHKAQGSAFDECVVIPDKFSRDTEKEYAQWLYTAVTRASNKITIAK